MPGIALRTAYVLSPLILTKTLRGRSVDIIHTLQMRKLRLRVAEKLAQVRTQQREGFSAQTKLVC